MTTFDRSAFLGTKWGEGGHLTVVDVAPVEKGVGQIWTKVHCSECAKDPEMFGDAIFTTLRTSLRRGCIPCGCAKFIRLSESQYRLKLRRVCDLKGYRILHIGSGKNKPIDSTSVLSLVCQNDGHSWELSVKGVLSGVGCPACYYENKVKTEEDHIADFLAAIEFPAGTKFKRLSIPENNWSYHCPVCANDEYTRAGLCDGTFFSRGSTLKAGNLSCRCAKNVRLTKEQCEWKIRQSYDSAVSFIGWVDDSKYGVASRESKFHINCTEHGLQETYYRQFIAGEKRCKECKPPGGFAKDMPAHFYVLKILGVTGDFTGYGVSGQLDTRLKTHRKNLSEYGFVIDEAESFPMWGYEAWELEREVMKKFECSGQEMEGFRTEATHCHLYMDVIAHVEDFLQRLVDEPNNP